MRCRRGCSRRCSVRGRARARMRVVLGAAAARAGDHFDVELLLELRKSIPDVTGVGSAQAEHDLPIGLGVGDELFPLRFERRVRCSRGRHCRRWCSGCTGSRDWRGGGGRSGCRRGIFRPTRRETNLQVPAQPEPARTALKPLRALIAEPPSPAIGISVLLLRCSAPMAFLPLLFSANNRGKLPHYIGTAHAARADA